MVEALDGLAPQRRPLDWPRQWTAFDAGKYKGPLRPVSDPRSGPIPPRETLACMPQTLTLGGRACPDAVLTCDDRNAVYLTEPFGAPRSGRTAYLFAEIDVDADGEVTFHLSSDWWMQAWVDGEPLGDTLSTSNRAPLHGHARRYTAELAAGTHTLAVRAISGNGGWAFAGQASRLVGPAPEGDRDFSVEARLPFEVSDPARFASLSFVGPESRRPQLNGRDIPTPLSNMRYRVVPGIPSEMLHAGTNELDRAWDSAASQAAARVTDVTHFTGSGGDERLLVGGRLVGLTREAADIQTGPVLHTFGEDFFTLSCRTNMRVPAVLRVDEREIRSEPALIHRFTIPALRGGTAYPYTVGPAGADADRRRSGRVRTLGDDERFTFAVIGDEGPLPEVWQRTAAEVARRDPLFVVFCGDMVDQGQADAEWDEKFIGLARELFTNVPLYPAIGNHDKNGGLAERLFMTPGGGWNWSQRLGPVLLIGVDGAGDVGADNRWTDWLETQLDATDAAYVFLFNHYPAWSSAGHGRLDETGRPVEPTVRFARDVIVPALARHNATAMFNGHDHCYERSELPGGVTQITTGGAGAYLYDKTENPHQNPYSRQYVSTHHYCLVDVAPDACRLHAWDLEGTCIAEHTWQPRD
ncbi:MAG: metallophosphoesterase [Phycisphaerae bacterium]|nr:metallophosphoesterase [Phycisphaerae bacterium]